MLSQRLRIERFGGLRIGYHATNMLLRDAPPGQFSDYIALRGIRHESFSPAAAGHSRHEFSLLEMEPLRHLKWSRCVAIMRHANLYHYCFNVNERQRPRGFAAVHREVV